VISPGPSFVFTAAVTLVTGTLFLMWLGEATRFADLRQRLYFLIGALIVYRIGTFIPVPGIDPEAMAQFFEQQSGTILNMFNMFSGGALERLSIFALGIMPYISASIIMQMASVVVPTLAAIKKEGPRPPCRIRVS
jgi:preprotein translocase subunit SecY